MLKMFNSHSADSELTKYDNCPCEIQRELTKEEADIDDVGKMYHVRFMDGYETDVLKMNYFRMICLWIHQMLLKYAVHK